MSEPEKLNVLLKLMVSESMMKLLDTTVATERKRGRARMSRADVVREAIHAHLTRDRK